MRKAFLTVLLVIVTGSSWADSNDAEMLRFAKAIGIYDQIEAQRLAIQTKSEDVGQQYSSQILAAVPGLPKEYSEAIDEANRDFIAETKGYIDVDQAVSSYMELISTKMTKIEIRKVTEFYESNIGKKYTAANTAIIADWTGSFMDAAQAKVSDALQDYIEVLQGIVQKASEDATGK